MGFWMLKKIINTNFKKWLFCIPLLLISHSLLTANTTNQWTNSHPNSQTTLSKSASSNQYDPNLDEPVVYHINEHNVHINRQWAKWLDARGKNSSNGYNQFIGDIGKFVIDISQQTFQNQNLINQTLFEFELLGIDATVNLPQPCQIKTPNFGISNIGGFCPSYQEYDKFGENNKIKIEGKQLSSTSYSSIKFFSHKFEWYWGWFMAEFTLKVKLSNDLKSLLFNFHYDVQSYSGATAVDWGSKGVVGLKFGG